ncbi:MAG: FprA family A-type flavoprotein [Bacilli bacterium]|nr:FprA family A-type flavoprotein [Bacilli bacterium]
MIAYKISEGIYWVGAIDWNLRSFHGYSTDQGTTYNAYLILDDKITLVDNVKAGFTDEMIARISSVIDPGKIEVIISNHGEPDHSGSITKVLELAPHAKVYSSAPNGVKILNAIYGDLPIVPVKTNDTILIGRRTLQYVQAPMVHWPDNMVTYCPEDKILFSNDIFGQHYATSQLFDADNDLPTIIHEAKKYYANIVLPYSKQAKKVVEALAGKDIKMIATSHGVIWKDKIPEIMALYNTLVNSKKKIKAIVVYDSMWGNTAVMARTITEAFMEKNIEARLYNINDTEKSDIITEIVDAKYIAVGSSTFNNTMLPSIAAFLYYLKGLAPVDLEYIAFGSYGWGGQSINQIAELLDTMNFKPLINSVRVLYNPQTVDLTKLKTEIVKALD